MMPVGGKVDLFGCSLGVSMPSEFGGNTCGINSVLFSEMAHGGSCVLLIWMLG